MFLRPVCGGHVCFFIVEVFCEREECGKGGFYDTEEFFTGYIVELVGAGKKDGCTCGEFAGTLGEVNTFFNGELQALTNKIAAVGYADSIVEREEVG